MCVMGPESPDRQGQFVVLIRAFLCGYRYSSQIYREKMMKDYRRKVLLMNKFVKFIFLSLCLSISVVGASVFLGVLLFPFLCQAGPASSRVTIPGVYGSNASYNASARNLNAVSPNQIPLLKSKLNGSTADGVIIGATPSFNQSPDPNGSSQFNIYQYQPTAIIDWQSFNIGSNSSVNFYQRDNAAPGNISGAPHSNWACLNRIWDNNPSQIWGKLNADGQIYLINQNGILFGPGSQVNVYSLVASALNIRNIDFLSNMNGLNKLASGTSFPFYVEDGTGAAGSDWSDIAMQNPYSYQGITYSVLKPQGTDSITGSLTPGAYYNAAVSNYGNIQASGGYVFLIAPYVENGGVINAPLGQIGLAAGSSVTLAFNDNYVYSLQHTSASSNIFNVSVNDNFTSPPPNNDPLFGKAVNWSSTQLADGSMSGLYAPGGFVGMYGNNIEQWGVIRAITAYQNHKGQVELQGTGKVLTGSDSTIDLSVDASGGTVTDSSDIQPTVYIGARKSSADVEPTPLEIDLSGTITAPAGQVTLNAKQQIIMESGSVIDVSGVVASLPVAAIESYKLTSVELADAYTQKSGILLGQPITTTLVNGSSIGNLEQVILTLDRTALQRSIGGAWTKQMYQDPTDLSYHYYYKKQLGDINATVADGSIIVYPGAKLNFAAGAINYQGGYVNKTMLLSGGKLYDIASAPANLEYTAVLGPYNVTHKGVSFDVAESWTGIYYGGSSALGTYVPSYTQGGDAGSVEFNAKNVVLEGQLIGGTTRGFHQNNWTDWTASTNNPSTSPISDNDDLMCSWIRGLEVPHSGTLTIGSQSLTSVYAPTSISIVPDASETSIAAQLSSGTTIISAGTLNEAKLGTINLLALSTIMTAPNVSINLQPGGSFSAEARRIEHQGDITVPSGSISLIIGENGASNPPDQRIILGGRSVLDVSGQKIDNSPAGNGNKAIVSSGQISGGNIAIKDETDAGAGVFIESGAVVDVSGGYIISPKYKVTGGNAGNLAIQGYTLMLDGDLRGYALADTTGKYLGGSITLQSHNIEVTTTTPAERSDFGAYLPLPQDMQDPNAVTFFLAGNRFDDAGFTRITLNAGGFVIIDPNTTIAPSMVRLNNPLSTGQSGSAFGTGQSVGSAGRPDLIRLNGLDDSTAYMAGQSSFSATASKDPDGSYFDPATGSQYQNHLRAYGKLGNPAAKLTVSSGVVIRTTPTPASSSIPSTITLASPDNLDIDGTLESLSGNITMTVNGSLRIGSSASILAGGYNQPDRSSPLKGFPVNYIPVNGGTVSITTGTLTMSDGSFIDISGSSPVQNVIAQSSQNANASYYYKYTNAGQPGSIYLTYDSSGAANLTATINAHPKMAGLQGGKLSITNLTDMDVSGIDMQRYTTSGFDDISLVSRGTLTLNAMSATVGRKLTLDAHVIEGAGSVALQAPWIVLANTDLPTTLNMTTASPTADISLTSTGWIDVIGSVQFSGFRNVMLDAARDIRLNSVNYVGLPSGVSTIGQLFTGGSLTLSADRIYPGDVYERTAAGTITWCPGVYSIFTIEAANDIKIMPSKTPVGGPIYSAAGALTVTSDKGGIDIEGGTLAAPMGTITLNAGTDQMIYLGAGSLLTTSGIIPIQYGVVDSNGQWAWVDPYKPASDISREATQYQMDPTLINAILCSDGGNCSGNATPYQQISKGVTFNAGKTIIMSDAKVDVQGGGSLYAAQFQAGLNGTNDPLLKTNRYVVFKDNGFQQPGTEVYFPSGVGGLAAGYYSMIPLGSAQNARYAFLPGAYILEVQSGSTLPVNGAVSTNGYPLIVGQTSIADTSIVSTKPVVFSVRSAADVLAQEGNYLVPPSATSTNSLTSGANPLVSGDGGSITFGTNAKTVIINGALSAAPLAGFSGGKITLSSSNGSVYVEPSANFSSSLPADFHFNDSRIPDDPSVPGSKQYMIVSDKSLSENGFQEIDLGYIDASDPTNNNGKNTKYVTILAGSLLQAGVIKLAAQQQIEVQGGAQLIAKTNGTGEIDLITSSRGITQIDAGAKLQADQTFGINTGNLIINGQLSTISGAITIASSAIYVGGNNPALGGLYLDGNLWNTLMQLGFTDITLQSNSLNAVAGTAVPTGIYFQDNWGPQGTSLSATNGTTLRSITLDATVIDDFDWAAGPSGSASAANVTLSAAAVNIRNSGTASAKMLNTSNSGTFTADAVDTISIGGVAYNPVTTGVISSDLLFAHFKSIALNSNGDLVLTGKGSLTTGNADLNIAAARVVTASAQSYTQGSVQTWTGTEKISTNLIVPTNFVVYTGDNYFCDSGGHCGQNTASSVLNPVGNIAINASPSGAAAGTGPTSGGELKFYGMSLNIGTVIQSNGGTVDFNAMGNIHLGGKAAILAGGTSGHTSDTVGTDNAPGGQVTMQTDSGSIALDSGSVIDVAAGAQGDSGSIIVSAPIGGVTLAGSLNGAPNGGKGGSFTIDTSVIGDPEMANLITMLSVGKFTESVGIRTRTGNIDVANQTLTANNVKLTADGAAKDANGNLTGYINVSGTIDASSASGGNVELYAMNDLNIQSGGLVNASSTAEGSLGGTVTLSSSQGFVNINGGTINVGGGPTGVSVGTVNIRAQRTDTGNVNIKLNGGNIKGAKAVNIEAVESYNVANLNLVDSSGNFSISSNWTVFSTWLSNASTFYTNYTSAVPTTNPFYILPEIEVINTQGDIAVDRIIDLSNIKYGSATAPAPGVLTLRAAGNLNIQQNLIDAYTYTNINNDAPIVSNPLVRTWGFNLVAGADIKSANYMAVTTRAAGNLLNGDLTIANNTVVYTENAPIRFSSARDTVIDPINPGSGQTVGNTPGYMIDPNSIITNGQTTAFNMVYNLASFSGAIQGDVGRDLVVTGAIQTATGAININVGRDLQLQTGIAAIGSAPTLGAIRTTGELLDTSVLIGVDASDPKMDNLQNGILRNLPVIQETNSDVPRPIAAINCGNPNGCTLLASATSRGTNLSVSYLSSAAQYYWRYQSGGDINISVGGNAGTYDQVHSQWATAIGSSSNYQWDDFTIFTVPVKQQSLARGGTNIQNSILLAGYDTKFTADYVNGTAGIVTMAGGNVRIFTGGDFLAQTGTFGVGNLVVYSGGDITGRFVNANGQGQLSAKGNFGRLNQFLPAETPQIELLGSKFSVTAAGDALVGAVVNPTLASNKLDVPKVLGTTISRSAVIGCTYSEDSSISLMAGNDVTYTAHSPIYDVAYRGQTLGGSNYLATQVESVLPASVKIDAMGGNIYLLTDSLLLASSPLGNLNLSAGGTITGSTLYQTKIVMSDLPPSYWYGTFITASYQVETHINPTYASVLFNAEGNDTYIGQFTGDETAHGYYKARDQIANIGYILHQNDDQPILISAGGNIQYLDLYLPKQAEITAGGDINNFVYTGQNISNQDVSWIRANGNIAIPHALANQNSANSLAASGILQSGPGGFMVEAGGSIDLGSLQNGIQMNGNGTNNALPADNGYLILAAGYSLNKNITDVSSFFSTLRSAIDNYSQTKDVSYIDTARAAIIGPFFQGALSGSGNIDMTSSQIMTSITASDIYILAAGTLNLGKTAIPSATATISPTNGIATGSGGAINIFAVKDVNVQESRLMTFDGGDITVWSDTGSINAGRGSKTTVSASPPSNGKFSAPSIGSGIRAVTYGYALPGDIHLYAKGIIDAGEAGIAGGNIFIGAEVGVVNASNIVASGIVAGVPQTASASTSIGALSGTNSATQSSQAMSDASGAIGGRKAQTDQMIDDTLMKWLDVKVIDFILDSQDSGSQSQF